MTQSATTSRRWRWGLLALFSVAWLLHLPPIDNFFDNDDAWNYLLEAERLFRGDGSAWVQGGNYWLHQNLMRLIGSLSFVLRYALFDLWMPGWHLPQVSLHALNAVLLAVWVRRLLPRANLDLPLAAGLLFAVWPAWPHVVVWVGGTYDILAAAFGLGALIAFSDRRTTRGLLLYALAIMSKETGILLGPIFALQIVLLERSPSWRAAVQRLAPYALVGLALLALRGLQIHLGGSIDQAGLPGRTIAIGATSLFGYGPATLLAAIGFPVYSTTHAPALLVASLTAGLLLVGGAINRHALPRRLIAFSVLGAWLLLVPVLLMREEGAAFAPHQILFQARYLYLPLLLALPLIPLTIYGAHPHHGAPLALRRLLTVAICLAAAGLSLTEVLRATHVNEPAAAVYRTIAQAKRRPKSPPNSKPSDIYLLTNRYDKSTWRMALSRYFAYHFDARFHVVQRGSQRVFSHRQDMPFGLDFKDFYLQVDRQPFGPRPGDAWLLAQPPNPIRRIQIPATAPRRGAIRPITDRFRPVDAEATHLQPRHNSAIRLQITPGQPTDTHRPTLVAGGLWLQSQTVWGIRIRYRMVGPPPARGQSLWGHGQARLHWTAKGLPTAETYVSFPLIRDGRDHTIDLPLWLDPVWNEAPTVGRLGFSPGRSPGELTLHTIAIIQRASAGPTANTPPKP